MNFNSSTYYEEYKKKLITPDQAAKLVKSGDWVQYGEFVCQPKACDAALAKRKDELEDVKFRLVTMSWLPEVCKADPERESFVMNDWHFSGVSRMLQEKDLCNYIPITYHEGPTIYDRGYTPVDVSFQAVTAMDKNGFFNISTSNSLAPCINRSAKIKVAEVNTSLPVCLGGYGESIHISDIDYIVESPDNPPPLNLPVVSGTDADKKIAELILADMRDGDCLQLGIGGMPNLVGEMISKSDLKDLGVHTEMLCDSFVDMYEAGKLTGKRKNIDPGKIVYTFAMGSKKLYDFLDHNPACAIFPVDYTNDPYLIARMDNMCCINNAIEIDLFGQVASEASMGRHISGTGGQLDFILGSFDSKNGRGYVALSSSIMKKDGSLESRIVPGLSPGTIVTVPRSIAYTIVTEYGKFNLKGKSTWERSEGIINLAHPDFRDNLIEEANKFNIWRRSNKIS
ncbi:MAG: acetyl-CoA hydrolase/transferase C-terminal domain-containing protein [Eubacteriales bacterium]|jgi:butyryl-CoA:acetate CoA-transferase|nr:acetyl-CoA hydrolase/transferase C-terminal domain-containing protein [Syntrophomonas wolfei]MDD4390438.1 acetyl-CoA hydrolase/transferase C-terminal domain-containing protein [Eubacteriales bacterium]